MSHVGAMARKELRAYFLSPVALIFIGTFLVVTLFTFFWVEAFFSRNVADVRPLFAWLPLLLVFLAGALTMRLWSEEQKLGTLELLLTLPIRIERLVLGKFFAGLALVALALVFTLGLPVTVARMGDLDWGPVVGGYVAALLLASAYLAIGLCISSATENQIVALISTIAGLGVLHAVGSDPVTHFTGNRLGAILRSIGTGSRFASIERGVVDLGDVVYYLSLTLFFLFLNVAILRSKRWSSGEPSRPERRAWTLAVGLLAANLLALNLWIAPLAMPRIDLTENREYTVSATTRDLLRSLDAPLLIRGYFSAKTHPLLAPHVPRLESLIEEYAAISGGRVRAEFVDPRENQPLEEEANQSYGIRSFPFRVADRYEAGIVNSYFSILVKYGDQYQVLGFDDLVEVQASDSKIEVRLRNPEYDLTRAIKRAVYGFHSIESVFSSSRTPMKLTGYITPTTLPDNFKKLPTVVEKILRDLERRSGGKFAWKVVDPSAPGSGTSPDELLGKYGIRPFATSLFSKETFYFAFVLEAGDRIYRVVPSDSTTEADLRKELEAALRRAAPGFLKRVALVPKKSIEPDLPPQYGGRLPRGTDETRALREALSRNYEVQDANLATGRVPGDVDVLLLIGPKELDEKSRFAVDQFLMRGGTVVVFAGRYEMALAGGPEGGGLQVAKVTTGLEELLAAWGLRIDESMVLDTQNEPFPVPVVRDLGFARVQEIQLVRYPFFVDVRKGGMATTSPIVAGLPRVTVEWASPIVPVPPTSGDAAKREVVSLLASSADSWTQASTDIQPDFRRFPELGFAAPATGRKSHVLAVAVRGKFASAFAHRPSPLFAGEGVGTATPAATGASHPDASASSGAPPAEGDRTGRTLLESPDGTRLVVVGSSAFVNDQVIALSRQTSTEGSINNLRFVENVVDWAVEDVDLLKIRARGSFARTLVTMDSGKRAFWEWLNYGLVLGALGIIAGAALTFRKRVRPMELDPKRTTWIDDEFRPKSDSPEGAA